MQFKHPELLYALLLLLIPIFIHLFQLRRFQKIDFTNVAFLKKVTIQTRKSSQLKKWLTLLARLLALACIVLAFAQPFTASKTALNTEKETVLYIDNSFSMQAKGSQGPLLQRSLQELFTQASGDDKLHWFTNDFSRRNVTMEDFKGEVLSIDYSYNQLSPETVLLQANQLFSKDPATEKRLVYISDFQGAVQLPELDGSIVVEAVQLAPVAPGNIAIDTAYISSKGTAGTQLDVVVSVQGEAPGSIPVSLYSGNTLIAKSAADFSQVSSKTISFDLEDTAGFVGRLSLNEPQIPFDNQLYFSINTPDKIKVLSINQAPANFLQRLFTSEEFEYTQQSYNELNYNDIPNQNLVVLNELQDIPASLSTALAAFAENGGSVLIIPSEKAVLTGYNALLGVLGLGSLTEFIPNEKKITGIAFSHPLFEGVFDTRVDNFQFPKVNGYFDIVSGSSPALRYEDGKAFLLQSANSYLFTGPINQENSNFQSSPLIVPSIDNMAQLSLPLPELYYQNGVTNTYAVPVSLVKDEILTLRDSISSFIPLQQTKANKVLITTTDEPPVSGTFRIERDQEFLEHVSYNFPREESLLQYANTDDWQGARVYDSVGEVLQTLAEENAITSFWKWFVIFALIFLVAEMLILKFFT